jgi:hypothetical protein
MLRMLEHIWMLIGISKTCFNMTELKQRMAEHFGSVPVQYTLYLPAPGKDPV